MLTLIIDSSGEKSIIALGKGSSIVAERQVSARIADQFLYADTLAAAVQELLKDHHYTAQDLSRIGVGAGPGSYTGIRVGVSFAQGLALALGIPLISFCSLMGYPSSNKGAFISITDARAGGAYCLRGHHHGDKVEYPEAPEACSLSALIEKLQSTPLAISPHTSLLKNRLEPLASLACQWEEREFDSAACLKVVDKKHQEGDVVPQGCVEILYLRKSQAERNLESYDK
jgi:tRNA threonylcarbamoyladenosine biosynthesis protein TsaB